MRFPLLHRIPRESKVAAVLLGVALVQVALLATLGLRSTDSRLTSTRDDLLRRTRQAVRQLVERSTERVAALQHEARRELARPSAASGPEARVGAALEAVDALAETRVLTQGMVVPHDGPLWHWLRPPRAEQASAAVDRDARLEVRRLEALEMKDPVQVRTLGVALADRILARPAPDQDVVAAVLALRSAWRAALRTGPRVDADPTLARDLAQRVLDRHASLLDDRPPPVGDRVPFGIGAASVVCRILAEQYTEEETEAFVDALLRRRRLGQELAALLDPATRQAERDACRAALQANVLLQPVQRERAERGLEECDRIDAALELADGLPRSRLDKLVVDRTWGPVELPAKTGPVTAFLLPLPAGGDDGAPLAALLVADPQALREYALAPFRREVDLPLGAELLVRDGSGQTYLGDPEATGAVDEVPMGPGAPGLTVGAVLAVTRMDQELGAERLYWMLVLAGTSLAVVAGALLAVRALRRELRLARMKSDFVSNLSHELRTPLTSLRMFVETLLEGRVRDEAERRECLEVIAQETGRLAGLVDRILSFAAFVKGRAPIELEPADPGRVVGRAVDLFRERAAAAGASLEFNVERGLPETLLDKDAAIQVILNLLDNAVKYAGQKGARILVSVRAAGRGVVIHVEDDGPGVPPRERELVFEEFYRGNDMLSGPVQGTGIGLALSRRIVRAHGGTVECGASAALGGARFTVTFPDPQTARRLAAAAAGGK